MLIGGLVVLGFVSLPRLGVDLWPRIEFPMVVVQAVLPGAAPETMESEVSEVLEEAINTIEGIRDLRSFSSDSLSLVYIEFELEYDVQEKAQQVREKVAAVRGDLPSDVEPPIVDRVDPDAQPVLAVLLAGPYSIRSLSLLADQRVKTRLERIPGVGSASLVGDRPREIRVWIDPLRSTRSRPWAGCAALRSSRAWPSPSAGDGSSICATSPRWRTGSPTSARCRAWTAGAASPS
jgi:HAE1 family hydrophobic/amphiphilic exporter-1